MSNSKPVKLGGISAPRRLPAWINSKTKQRVVVCRDRSASMSHDGKARDAEAACQDLVRELARPENKDAFEVAVIDFNTAATQVNPLTSATALCGHIVPLAPAGRTNITAAFEVAKATLSSPPATPETAYVRPVVILFSDGCHNEGPGPQKIASELARIADIVTAAFGSDADEPALQALATSPQHARRCRNGAELRAWLSKVGQTLTRSLPAGNATRALAGI